MNLTILDDSISEDDEHFLVHLINPTGGASVGVSGGTVKVTIVNSDDAYGVIEFEPISLNIVSSEGQAQPTTVTLSVC